jgi:predicted  nucleic acid-binding Zn-ribbon protein
VPPHPFRAVRIWVGDIDSDGDLDILAGDQVSVSHAAKDIDRETFEKKLAAWEKGMKEVREKLSATKDTTEQRKLQERWSDLYAERSKFVEDELSGFVWLYRRK